jgi:transposase-like protein
MEKHKPYTSEYKLAAIKLAQTEGIGKTASNFGINANMLGRCKESMNLVSTRQDPSSLVVEIQP